MKKLFIYSSPAKEDIISRNNVQTYNDSGQSIEVEARKRLFRQPLSCPHFSIRIEDLSSLDESTGRIRTGKRPPFDCTDVKELMRTVERFVDNEFIHLNYAVPPSNEFFTPYSYRQVPYSEVDKDRYFTISRNGVAMWGRRGGSFTPFHVWKEEYEKYCVISKIKVFAQYRLWKPFRKWRKTIKYRKFNASKAVLRDNLILANPALGQAVTQLKNDCKSVTELIVFRMDDRRTWQLNEFNEVQTEVSNGVRDHILAFHKRTVTLLDNACSKALKAHGFKIESQISSVSSMKYADRLKKRRFCKLLARFLRYVDYMALNLLYDLALTSSEFLVSAISATSREDQSPFLVIEIQLSDNGIITIPSQMDTVTTVKEVLDRRVEALKSLTRFETNEVLKKFTEPIIGGRIEKRLYPIPLDIEHHFCVDNSLVSIRSRAISMINDNFDELQRYICRFEAYRDLFVEDSRVIASDLAKLTNVDDLHYHCARYIGQMDHIRAIEPAVKLGIFRLDQRCFDKQMSPFYGGLYAKICSHLPVLVASHLADMHEQCQEIMGTLLTPPEGTTGFVVYLNYLNECEAVLDALRMRLNNVDKMLQLISEYQMEVSNDLTIRFQAIGEFLGNCGEALVKKRNQKTVFLDKLATCIEKDVERVFEEVTEIEGEISKDWILSEESQPALVRESISALLDQLLICQKTLNQLQSHAAAMQLPTIDFGRCDEVLQAVTVRQLLWHSLAEWTNAIQEWYMQNFHQLDIDRMVEVNCKILQHCQLFDDHLPENSISTKLRVSVELFKDKIEIIRHIRNESLQLRHWRSIEEILQRSIIEDDQLTIKDFEEAGAFTADLAEQLMKISMQACAELELERRLCEVEEFWMDYELQLEQYRYYRDNFILVELDEVESRLDDSFIKMTILRSSDHVGPIIEPVDEWIANLALCSKTLAAWKSVQQKYIRLELLFTMPGMEFKIPVQVRSFQEINQFWRRNIGAVHKNRHVMEVFANVDRLNAFDSVNLLLNDLIDQLDEFLDSRRMSFPRLFFVSNDELLDLLTEHPQTTENIQRHLPKIFDSVHSLIIQRLDIPCLYEPQFRITDLVSNTGAALPLLDSVEIRGLADQWLQFVQIEMICAVDSQLKEAYQSFEDRSIVDWITETELNQVAFTILHVKRSEAMETYPEKVSRWFQCLVECKVNGTLSNDKLSLVEALILSLERFIPFGDPSRSVIDHQHLWTYQWKTDGPIFSIGDQKMRYYNEFISDFQELVYIPPNDRCFWNFMRTMKNGLQNGLYGANRSTVGSSTVKALAKLMGKHSVLFECNERHTNYGDFQRVLFGMVQSGTWVILTDVDRVPVDILSTIGDQLMLIAEAKAKQAKTIELTGQTMKLNASSQLFFVCDSLEDPYDRAIPASLRIFLRNTAVDMPYAEVVEEIRRQANAPLSIEEGYVKFQEGLGFHRVLILHGAPGCGKSHIWQRFVHEYNNTNIDQILTYVLYVNSHAVEDLYGGYVWNKWQQGFFEKIINSLQNEQHCWIICDGDIESNWCEPLLRLDDHNPFITLPNLARLRIPDNVKTIIECSEIKNSIPLGNSKLIQVFQAKEHSFERALERLSTLADKVQLTTLYVKYFLPLLDISNGSVEKLTCPMSDRQKVEMMVSFLEAFVVHWEKPAETEKIFAFCSLWSIGSNLTAIGKVKLERELRTLLSPEDVPSGASLWDCYVCTETGSWKLFDGIRLTGDPSLKLSMDTITSTKDSIRLNYFISKLQSRNNNSLLILNPDNTLSFEIIQAIQTGIKCPKRSTSNVFLSSTTTSIDIQAMLELNLIRRGKSSLGPPINTRHTYFIDNLQSDNCQSVEFLRQMTEKNGYCSRDGSEITRISDINFVAFTTEVSSPMLLRLAQKCLVLGLCDSRKEILQSKFDPLIVGLAKVVNSAVIPVLNSIPKACVAIWELMEADVSQQPTTFYDLKRLLVGLLHISTLSIYSRPEQLIKLFLYECCRVFCDRVISEADRKDLEGNICGIAEAIFGQSYDVSSDTVFGDFSLKHLGKADRVYEEIKDLEKVKLIFDDYLQDYNRVTGYNYSLFWHDQGVHQLAAVTALIRAPQFHGLVTGSCGLGKKLFCKLAAFINGYKVTELPSDCDKESIRNFIKDSLAVVAETGQCSCWFISSIENAELLKIVCLILDEGWPPILFDGISNDDFAVRVLQNLHILFILDDDEARVQGLLRAYPVLRRRCSRYHFHPWSDATFKSIAMDTFKGIPFKSDDIREKLSQLATNINASIRESGDTMLNEKYLHMMQLYEKVWLKKNVELECHRKRLSSCLDKLTTVIALMATMQEDLRRFLPQLEEQRDAMKELNAKLESDVTLCELIRSKVTVDEASAKIQTANTQVITDDTAKDLEIAMPALRAAQDQMRALTKSDMSELKGQNSPAKLVVFVMEAVCILVKIKPDWPTAKAFINDPSFLKNILDFDKEHVHEAVLRKIKPYVEHKDFDPAKIEKVSKVCKCLCLWVRAIDQFAKVFKIVEPKVRKQQHAEAALRDILTALRRQQQELVEAESRIQALRDTIEVKDSTYKVVQENVNLINLRLTRACRVTTALADEKEVWTADVERLERELKWLPCDVLMTAASISYLSQCRPNTRRGYLTKWVAQGQSLGFDMNTNYDLAAILTIELERDCWKYSMGLPLDEASMQNAVTVKHTLKWPLLIDVNGKMNLWLRNFKPNLRSIHHRDQRLDQVLEESILSGSSLLIHSITVEAINHFLLDIVRRDVYSAKESEVVIRTRTKSIPYNSDFFLYMATQVEDRDNFPQTFLNHVNVIDCAVLAPGLEYIMLNHVSRVEFQALDSQSRDVQLRIEEDTSRMATLQGIIVQLLSESTGNLLDDEKLVANLYETKETYSIVTDRLADSRESEKVLAQVRDKYHRLAFRAARLMTLIEGLERLNPLYRFPMDQFVNIFCTSIQKLDGDSVESQVNQDTLAAMLRKCTMTTFSSFKGSLFNEDRVVLALSIALLEYNELSRDLPLDSSNIRDFLGACGTDSNNQIEVKMVKFFETHFGADVFKRVPLKDGISFSRDARQALVIVPANNSLAALLEDLKSLYSNLACISVGSGNEHIAVTMLDAALTNGHALVLQNVSLTRDLCKMLEQTMVRISNESEPLPDDFKLILILQSATEVPRSLLCEATKIVYYGKESVVDTINTDSMLEKLKLLEQQSDIW